MKIHWKRAKLIPVEHGSIVASTPDNSRKNVQNCFSSEWFRIPDGNKRKQWKFFPSVNANAFKKHYSTFFISSISVVSLCDVKQFYRFELWHSIRIKARNYKMTFTNVFTLDLRTQCAQCLCVSVCVFLFLHVRNPNMCTRSQLECTKYSISLLSHLTYFTVEWCVFVM